MGFILQEILGQLRSLPYFHSAPKPKFSPLSPSKSVVINYTVKTSTALPLLEPGSDSHCPVLLLDITSVPAAPTYSWLGIALPGEAPVPAASHPPCQSNWGQAGSTQHSETWDCTCHWKEKIKCCSH